MSSINDMFQSGDLPGAIAAVTAQVRASPREAGLRWLLSELQLYAGDIERADRALDSVIEDTPSPPVLEFRRLLRAEEVRRQVFREGRLPKFQGDEATPAQTAAMQALTLARLGDAAGAAQAAAEAEALRPRTPGTATLADGTSFDFDDLRDADDIFAPMFEVLTSGGDYMWVPVERLGSLAFDAARRPRDLYWRRTQLTLKDGTEGLVFVPAIYPWTDAATPMPLKLGRETDWPEPGAGPVRGLGQRVLLVGEEAVALADAASLTFT
jgi:type VI secretion system protein ImpE